MEMDNGGATEWRNGGNRSDISDFSDAESDRNGYVLLAKFGMKDSNNWATVGLSLFSDKVGR